MSRSSEPVGDVVNLTAAFLTKLLLELPCLGEADSVPQKQTHLTPERLLLLLGNKLLTR